MLDHPVIRNMELYGTPDGRAVVEPKCPICGSTTMAEVYRDGNGEIVGCEECLTAIDPWDCPECTGEDER